MRRPQLTLSLLAAGLCTALPVAGTANPRPDVIFLLLDTTRADRMSAWGNRRLTTPNLDRLARDGIRFARHFANSHATRPSMPQLMSGRYYQSSILREFRPRTHPRDWPFAATDPTLALLPELLKQAGYELLAVSAHPWIARESTFGTPFDRFEEPVVPSQRGHADAASVVDHALRLWRARDRDRPALLYLHFMDPHIPRHVPQGRLRFGDDDPVVRARFDEAGEPRHGGPWHEWDRSDARAFTTRDVRFFTDVYDTILAEMDGEIGRLLVALRAEDPDLARTLLVVVADHGEELGEHGRISHDASLDDAVQHIPWILGGAGILPGQTASGVTENVDVLPTMLDVANVDVPAGVRFDGRSMVEGGRVCSTCLRTAATYAWEDYRALRLGTKLVRERLPDSLDAYCDGARILLAPDRRTSLVDDARVLRAARLLGRVLDEPERRFRRSRFLPPDRSFTVLPRFWRIRGDASVSCVAVGPATNRNSLLQPGWVWTGRGLALFSSAETTGSLPIRLEVPDGTYEISLGVRDLGRPPHLFGYETWLRRRVRRSQPTAIVPIGTGTAREGWLDIDLPASIALRQHVVQVRLRPLGHPEEPITSDAMDPELRERLRRLGYVH